MTGTAGVNGSRVDSQYGLQHESQYGRQCVSQYALLCRTFFAQLFATESVASELQFRQALIGVFAFLVTPGLLLPFRMDAAFALATIRYATRPPGFPGLLEPLVRLFATICIAYSIVTIGFIAAFTWDALGFDRRDAMVLGPLPLRGSVAVRAKLTALAGLLLTTAASVSVMTALPFAMIASNYNGASAVARHALAHMVATMSAATCVFCLLVTLRALLSLIGHERKAIASVLQFAVVSGLLCFIVLLPSALRVVPGRRRAAAIHLVTLPDWDPTSLFLGLYETVRGTADAGFRADARVALVVTLAALTTAILGTIVGYRLQLQRALAPSASAEFESAARLPRAVARSVAGRDQVSRAIADFIVITLARNRAQQTPIVMNAAIGMAIVAAGLSRAAGDPRVATGLRTAVLWIPLVGAYWIAVGLRASFFVPSELPAAWMIQANGPATPRAYWSATRAAAVAVIVPPALLLAVLLVPLLGWRVAAPHAAVVGSVGLLLAEGVALTIDFIPYTRPYRAGHARLKSRWPLYLLGLWVFAVWPARFEVGMAGRAAPLLGLAASAAALVAIAEFVAGRRAGRRLFDAGDQIGADLNDLTVLGIATAERSAVGA